MSKQIVTETVVNYLKSPLKEEYKKAYLEVKSKELQDEISKIEIQQIKTRARNANLLQNIRKTLE